MSVVSFPISSEEERTISGKKLLNEITKLAVLYPLVDQKVQKDGALVRSSAWLFKAIAMVSNEEKPSQYFLKLNDDSSKEGFRAIMDITKRMSEGELRALRGAFGLWEESMAQPNNKDHATETKRVSEKFEDPTAEPGVMGSW